MKHLPANWQLLLRCLRPQVTIKATILISISKDIHDAGYSVLNFASHECHYESSLVVKVERRL